MSSVAIPETLPAARQQRSGPALQDVGVVAIGRNEGVRLERCLLSARSHCDAVVYVDSGSTDGSVPLAQSLGVTVVELDLARPFTAARARNAGFAALMAAHPDVQFVMFVDGDCELAPDWLPTAKDALAANPGCGVVCGRRRERSPDASIYNLLCDMEWDTSIGDAKACGGDALMRCAAFQSVAGFRDDLIAGEEPELCVRLRQRDWTISRIDAEMTRHDAAMTSFRQWWKRSVRAGHAYAEGALLHGLGAEQHWLRESVSIWLFALLLPAFILAVRGPAWLLLGVYPLQFARIAHARQRTYRIPWSHAALYAGACLLGKFAQCQGQLTYLFRVRGRRTLIEYKTG